MTSSISRTSVGLLGLLLWAVTASADSINQTQSASGTLTSSVTYNLYDPCIGYGFGGGCSYQDESHEAFSTGTQSQPFSLTFSSFSVPTGQALTDATLNLWMTGATTQSVESASQSCNSSNCSGFVNPAAYYGFYFSSLTDGSRTVSLSPGDGSLDLMALGFGNDILSNTAVTVTGQAYVDPPFCGYQSHYCYNIYPGENEIATMSASVTFDPIGQLTADYQPATVPEPSSLALLVSGLASGVFGFFRKTRLTFGGSNA